MTPAKPAPPPQGMREMADFEIPAKAKGDFYYDARANEWRLCAAVGFDTLGAIKDRTRDHTLRYARLVSVGGPPPRAGRWG